MAIDASRMVAAELEQSPLTSAALEGSPALAGTTRPINLLAYVHLRNIYRSTGAGRVARQLIEHLAAREDVSLRVLADAGDQQRIVPLVGEPWQGFRYHTFSSETSRQQARWFALGQPRAERFWPEADIIFCTGESYVPKRKARLVVTAHDAAYFERGAHVQNAAFFRQQLKWRFLFRRLSSQADMIHTVSQFSADRLAHHFPALASRIRVVHNAVAPHFFAPVPQRGTDFVRAQGLLGRPFVLVPGGLHFRKNADLILTAAPRLLNQYPDLVLALVNHSDPVYARQAEALGSRVRLLGFVEEDALQALYAAATVVWFPSRYEGFGLPVLEAMAAGTPVVASRASSLPEISGDAALLAGATDADDHLEKLFLLLDNSRVREDFSRRGHAHAQQFTWQRSAAQLKHHFDRLLSA